MDAYTVKKVLPRIVIAAIAINLSYYLMVVAIDITNIIGDGISNLIVFPFTHANPPLKNWDPGELSKIIMSVLLAFVAFKAFNRIFSSGSLGARRGLSNAKDGFSAFMLGIALPIGLIVLSIFVVLTIRLGLILGLVIGAPVAISLFVLPSTEKLFKKWLQLFATTLMIYPIVMALIALGRVMTYIFGNIDGQTVAGLTGVFAVLAQFIPLALIPFSFKLAGGMIGSIGKFIDGQRGGIKSFVQGDEKDPNSRINRAKLKANEASLIRREEGAKKMSDWASNSNRNRLTRGVGRRLAHGIGGVNIEAERAATNKSQTEAFQAWTATGPDARQRALTVNKAAALRGRQATQDADGNWSDGDWREHDGKRQFRTLGGAWVDESYVDEAHSMFGGNQAAFQAALQYEMGKASSEQEVRRIQDNYVGTAQAFGMTERQAKDVWKGASFSSQNRHLAFKHMGVSYSDPGNQGNGMSLNGGDFLKDVYENKDAYSMSHMNAETINAMRRVHADASDDLINLQRASAGRPLTAQEQARQAEAERQVMMTESIADTFTMRAGMRLDDNGNPTGETSSMGPGHTSDELWAFGKQVTDSRALRQGMPMGGGAGPVAPPAMTTPNSPAPTDHTDDTNTAGGFRRDRNI